MTGSAGSFSVRESGLPRGLRHPPIRQITAHKDQAQKNSRVPVCQSRGKHRLRKVRGSGKSVYCIVDLFQTQPRRLCGLFPRPAALPRPPTAPPVQFVPPVRFVPPVLSSAVCAACPPVHDLPEQHIRPAVSWLIVKASLFRIHPRGWIFHENADPPSARSSRVLLPKSSPEKKGVADFPPVLGDSFQHFRKDGAEDGPRRRQAGLESSGAAVNNGRPSVSSSSVRSSAARFRSALSYWQDGRQSASADVSPPSCPSIRLPASYPPEYITLRYRRKEPHSLPFLLTGTGGLFSHSLFSAAWTRSSRYR